MLSQFLDIESVFVEVQRVLAPGGVFLFAEESLKRLLTLRLYRCPYYDTMKPWERKLYDWGLLGIPGSRRRSARDQEKASESARTTAWGARIGIIRDQRAFC